LAERDLDISTVKKVFRKTHWRSPASWGSEMDDGGRREGGPRVLEMRELGLVLELDTRLNAARVRDVLAPLIEDRGAPGFVCSDNGSELVARLLAVFPVGVGLRELLHRSSQSLAERVGGVVPLVASSGPLGRQGVYCIWPTPK